MLNGYFLRLELLGRYGHGRQALDEAVDYFLPMADETGTLWEHAGPLASCCHGFASHVAVTLCRHVFGVERVDAGGAAPLRPSAGGYRGHLVLPLGGDPAGPGQGLRVTLEAGGVREAAIVVAEPEAPS
jgi:hypothetical protein